MARHMKHSYFKQVILVVVLAFACAPAVFSQVNINAPTGLNPNTQTEPEKKVETPAPATTTAPATEATEGEKKEATTTTQTQTATPRATRPSTSTSNRAQETKQQKPKQSNRTTNNTAVNAPATAKKPWVDSKKPESLNRDFSTGKNSSNLQSRQEVEMRSYGYRILVYNTNKSKNAKANAQKRARDIALKFPQYQFYFNYKAPTWRLRMGDFADEEAAHRALKQMRQAFPMYAKEMTIIHDHINVWK